MLQVNVSHTSNTNIQYSVAIMCQLYSSQDPTITSQNIKKNLNVMYIKNVWNFVIVKIIKVHGLNFLNEFHFVPYFSTVLEYWNEYNIEL